MKIVIASPLVPRRNGRRWVAACVVAITLAIPCTADAQATRCGAIDVVVRFGADPSGATSSTASLQAALDEAVACGGEVVAMPAGRYLVDAPLRIGNGVTFRGSGSRSTVLLTSGRQNLLVNENVIAGNRDIGIEGLGLVGAFDGDPTDRWAQQLIRLERVAGFVIRDVEVSRSRGNGVVIGRDCSGGTVEKLSSHDNAGIGVYVQNSATDRPGGAVSFVGSRADDNGSSGFAAYRSGGLSYDLCRATGNGRIALDGAGFNLDGCRDVVYRGCVARGNGVGFASYSANRNGVATAIGGNLRYQGCLAAKNRDRGFLFHSPLEVEMRGCDVMANGAGGTLLLSPDSGEDRVLSVVGGAVRANRGKPIDAGRRGAVDVVGVVKGINGREMHWRPSGTWRATADESCAECEAPDGDRSVGQSDGPDSGCPELTQWPDEAVEAVAVADGIAYLATQVGLVVLDVTEPNAPVEVGRMLTPTGGRAVEVAADLAYLTTDTALFIIDVGVPSQPSVVGSLATIAPADAVAVSGSSVLLAAGDEGLRVVDASDPSHPVEIAAIADPWEARDVVARGSYAYVAAGWSGLRIVDLSDPTHPFEIGAADTRRAANGVDLAGKYAFLAVTQQAAVAVNVLNPAAPFMIWHRHTSGVSEAIAVGQGFAHIASRFGGVTTYDISLPTEPTLVDSYDTPGRAVDIALAGGIPFVADRTEGLAIWWLCTIFTDSFESRSTDGWDRQPAD